MTYDNNLTGIISKNDRKEQDSHPDIRGECEIEGVKYWISGWQKQRKDGSGSFYSLKFKPKDAALSPAPRARQDTTPRRPNGQPAPAYTPDLDDEIPF